MGGDGRLDLSVISSDTLFPFSINLVHLGACIFRELELSELVNVLLFDRIDGHAYVSHPVGMARWHHIGSLVGETVVSVQEHNHVSKSNLVNDWAELILEGKIVKEVINRGDTLFSAEKGGWAIY